MEYSPEYSPKGKMREVAMMLKAIHAQENKKAAREKAKQVAERLREMKLGKAAKRLKPASKKHLRLWIFPASIGPVFVQTTCWKG